jgi:hypothetical protein
MEERDSYFAGAGGVDLSQPNTNEVEEHEAVPGIISTVALEQISHNVVTTVQTQPVVGSFDTSNLTASVLPRHVTTSTPLRPRTGTAPASVLVEAHTSQANYVSTSDTIPAIKTGEVSKLDLQYPVALFLENKSEPAHAVIEIAASSLTVKVKRCLLVAMFSDRM